MKQNITFNELNKMMVEKDPDGFIKVDLEYIAKQLLKVKGKTFKNSIDDLYPEKGPLCRDNYKPHMEFFKAGKDYRERCIMAANRIGKSLGVGGYELTLHLTGNYPPWWEGRRFNKPIRAWAAGDTSQTVRDIGQEILLGPPNNIGTGLIPAKSIKGYKKKAGSVPDAIESVTIDNVFGGQSRLVFKSYDQKRQSFEGTSQDVIWLDEEPSMGIYTECLLRTMTTNGLVLLTFTPLMGLSEVVMAFLPGGKLPTSMRGLLKWIVQATWDDAPHLSDKEKKELWESIPPFQRDARTKGIPQLGAGVIYPISENEIEVDDFEIPPHWPRCYALDVGWNATAALWAAWNREDDIVYLYSNYKRGEAEPPVHTEAIKSRGEWIPGVIDPASRGRSQIDGKKLFNEYRNAGLKIQKSKNAVEAGIYAVWLRLSTGRMKVFKSCREWFEEFRLYRRDERGKVVKEFDHLMDDTKYIVLSGLEIADVMPFEEAYPESVYELDTVNEYTGY